ncbi:hypothetical protein L873DRAFT_859077 [Choiromyces venosus 120613-1]|uniref:Uncharacterized protein n=1 Tax=Choiromyces venosus 120613-1 TaxID=1336337 RepID=A0A3N4IRH1_9PEZI|nr:hypothetical protein L873DRAFT_859077 [Choiromyces venosus 120613-1]
MWVCTEEADVEGGLRVQEVYSVEIGVEACAWFVEVRDAGGGGDSSSTLGEMLPGGGGSDGGALGKGGTRKRFFWHFPLGMNSATARRSRWQSVSGGLSAPTRVDSSAPTSFFLKVLCLYLG